MKVFLDIGSHKGQSILAVVNSRHKFDKIVGFEPSKALFREIKERVSVIEGVEIVVENFGLYNKNCKQKLYSPETLSGSIFSDKFNVNQEKYEICEFRSASGWFRKNISSNDIVYAKLNCEGAEIDILEDLIHSGEINKIKYLRISFDIDKVPSQVHRKMELIKKLNRLKNISWMTKYEVTPARYQGKKLQNWLKDTESSRWKLNLLKPYNICVNKTFEVLGKVRVKLQRLL